MQLSNKGTKEGLAGSSFYLEDDFYEMADTLRAQFEEQISAATGQNGSMTPLIYAFCRDAFQFLTASADRLFAGDILENLIDRLRAWANEAVGTSSVSTPQVRVYINGCRRHLLRDDCSARWHYMLSLTRQPKKGGWVKILAGGVPKETTRYSIGIDRTLSLQLKFNQLLVHNTSSAYSVEPAKTSMNPCDGAIFVDGYLW